jgi:hypothetical protein
MPPFSLFVLDCCRSTKQTDKGGQVQWPPEGIAVFESESVTHLLFIDDIFCSLFGSQRNLNSFKNILNLYCSATGMKVNMEKSCLILNHCAEAEESSIANTFPSQRKPLSEGLKYLGFNLKPENYRKEDWSWLIRKVEAEIAIWVNRLLSRGGRLVLIKAILEGIPCILELYSCNS